MLQLPAEIMERYTASELEFLMVTQDHAVT